MENIEEITKLIKTIPTPKASQEFKTNLGDSLAQRAQELQEAQEKQQKKSLLFPWQLALAFSSFVFLLLITLTIFTSTETKERMIRYLKQEAQSAFSKITIVTVKDINKDDVTIFVYNLLEENKPPLNVTINQIGPDIELLLYPGYYKLVFIKEGEPVLEKNIVIEDGEEKYNLDINFTDNNG